MDNDAGEPLLGRQGSAVEATRSKTDGMRISAFIAPNPTMEARAQMTEAEVAMAAVQREELDKELAEGNPGEPAPTWENSAGEKQKMVEQGGVKMREMSHVPTNPTFSKYLWLSFRMGLLIVVFFSPIIFANPIGDVIFGKDCATALTPDSDSGICGLTGSPDLKGYWPNVVQLMFFTVYSDLGNTVQLAWQGMAGTYIAGLNQVFMSQLFPVGGKCKTVGTERLMGVSIGLRTTCAEFEDPNFESMQWLVWLDVVLVVLLILMSNANENSMKFSLSWHLAYMMAFMSPSGYTPSHAVNTTSFFAVVMAILVVLPKSTRTIGVVERVPRDYVTQFRHLIGSLSGFLKLSPTLSNDRRTAIKFDLEHRLSLFHAAYAAMDDQYSSTWWEMIVPGVGGRRVRSVLWVFKECLKQHNGFYNSFNVMKKAVSAEYDDMYFGLRNDTEKAKVQAERDLFIPLISNMNHAVADLLECIANGMAKEEFDFEKDDIEKLHKELLQKSAAVKQAKEELERVGDAKKLFVCGRADWWNPDEAGEMNSSVARRHLRNNLLIFIYGCITCAVEAIQLAEESYEGEKAGDLWKQKTVHEKENKRHAHNYGELPRASWEVLKQVVIEDGLLMTSGSLARDNPGDVDPMTGRFYNCKLQFFVTGYGYWRPAISAMFASHEKWSFVWTNTLAISLAFLLGNVLDGGVWAPYSAGMAGTLGVLISHSAGSAVYKNLMRLLGIALGKVTPVMLIAIVYIFNDGTEEHGLQSVIHSVLMFAYMMFFANVYYTSPQWGLVGCLCAGFGCYAFVSPAFNDATFTNNYKEIGSVTFAIFMQIAIDTLDAKLVGKWPRDQAVQNLRKITYGSDTKELKKNGQFRRKGAHIMKAFNAIFNKGDDEHLKKAKQHIEAVDAVISGQAAIVSDCENKTIIIPGPRCPFKLTLYKEAIELMRKIKREIDICYMIKKSHMHSKDMAINGGDGFGFDKDEIKASEMQIKEALPVTFKRLQTLLEMEGTEPLVEEEVIDEDRDDGYSKYKDTLNLPLCVARRTLNDVRALTRELNHLCFSSGFIKTDFQATA